MIRRAPTVRMSLTADNVDPVSETFTAALWSHSAGARPAWSWHKKKVLVLS